MTDPLPRRILAETATLVLRPAEGLDVNGEEFKPHYIDVTIAYDEERCVTEVAFTTRGKTGHGLDIMFQDAGTQLSRAIQGRNPVTGDPLDGLDGRGRSALWGRGDPATGAGDTIRQVVRGYAAKSAAMQPKAG